MPKAFRGRTVSTLVSVERRPGVMPYVGLSGVRWFTGNHGTWVQGELTASCAAPTAH